VARYGRPLGDLMVEHGWFDVLHAVALVRAECQQWFMATGERVNELRYLIFRSIIAAAAMLAAHPAAAEDHRFEADPVASVRENFVACEVLSQLQRVMENPRFLLAGECVPLRAGDRVRVYASRGPYACIYPHDTIAPCKWTHQKALSK
jgi:hypothetical protein